MSEAQEPRSVLRRTDAEAIRLGRTLIRTARSGALATLDPASGAPLASRVGVATNGDGTPLILISALAAHTGALLADPRCSLLIGETGKGDPLAHPRATLSCRAERLARETRAAGQAARRYLARNPKAQLYAGLGDFALFRLAVDSASLNGGFGRAYALQAADLILQGPAVAEIAEAEPGVLAHMNGDHAEAVRLYATVLAGATGADWTMTGVDPDGLDLAAGDKVERLFFDRPLTSAEQLRPTLVALAQAARRASAG